MRAQNVPTFRPVAPDTVIAQSRGDVVQHIDRTRNFARHQQGAAERRSGEIFRSGHEHHISAIEIFAEPATAEAHLAGIDHDLNRIGPAGRNLPDALIARNPPAELRRIHDLKKNLGPAGDRPLDHPKNQQISVGL